MLYFYIILLGVSDILVKLNSFSSYSAGTYMVRIETVKGSQFVKIIKK